MGLPKHLDIKINAIIKDYKRNSDDQTLKLIKDSIYSDQPKPRTITHRYSLTKKKFKSITSDVDFLKQIKPDISLTNSVIQQNKIIRDNKQIININEDLIKKILSFENSEDIFKLFMYLLLISGRRTTELLNSKINNIKGKGIQFEVAKRRNTTDDKFAIFNSLTSKSKFFKNYNKFKRLYKRVNQQTFQRTLLRKVNKYLGDNIRPHTLRGIYANYLYKFRNKQMIKINTFIKDVLSHKSAETSLNYTGYNIQLKKDIIK